MRVLSPIPFIVLPFAAILACGQGEEAAKSTSVASVAEESDAPADLPRGLLVGISRFETNDDGKPTPHSELLLLRRRGGSWKADVLEDPDAPVFHKAMVYRPGSSEPGILTLGGSVPKGSAALKLWRLGEGGLVAETLWEANFEGKFSRMRDAEIGDVLGDGREVLVVGTHDQGVLTLVAPEADGWEVRELDRQADTFIHEVELGDLDDDGVLEVYATPSEPNRLDGTEQHGEVVRYVPATGEGRTTVGDLGNRHAKEILVDDVDGDGTDELYVSIEAAEGGNLEIRRYDAGDPADGGVTIAELADPMCRFLSAGDLDGDGHKEMVAAAIDTGLWLLRPGPDPRKPWAVTLIDGASHGFEHAALVTDLDGDGTSELYVASDDDREIRRYVWRDGQPKREVIYSRPGVAPVLTWNLMPVPVELLP
jgi:hypothetical protein